MSFSLARIVDGKLFSFPAQHFLVGKSIIVFFVLLILQSLYVTTKNGSNDCAKVYIGRNRKDVVAGCPAPVFPFQSLFQDEMLLPVVGVLLVRPHVLYAGNGCGLISGCFCPAF